MLPRKAQWSMAILETQGEHELRISWQLYEPPTYRVPHMRQLRNHVHDVGCLGMRKLRMQIRHRACKRVPRGWLAGTTAMMCKMRKGNKSPCLVKTCMLIYWTDKNPDATIINVSSLRMIMSFYEEIPRPTLC